MTKQEIFDIVVKGILNQDGPSINIDGSCMYRGEDGRKCAAGWLIDDADYDSGMECQTCDIGTPVGDYLVIKKIDHLFVRTLQRIHDDSFTDAENQGCEFFDYWKPRMIKFAQENNLDYCLLN